MKRLLRRFGIPLLLGLASHAAHADWHQGHITRLMFGYDGSTVTFALSGWVRSDCTCYSAWPGTMCLNRSRASFKDEYAWLLKAKTVDQEIFVNIDETTCSVVAMYE